jgi:ABC-type nitrate/sulfonate/bicarbonate transport system substrate-binding protein
MVSARREGAQIVRRISLLSLALSLGCLLANDVAAEQRLAVSYPGIAGYNIPFWVAIDAGEFKKVGLDIDSVLISGGSKSMQALLSGGLDFANVSGGVSVQAALSAAEVTILQLGGERNRLTALERGVIAATIMSPPGLFVAEAEGYTRLGDLNAMGMRYPELSVVARKRDLKERRELVRRYLRAYVEGVRVMKTNRDATVRVIEKYIHVGSRPEAIKTYDYFSRSISDTLRTDREGIGEFLATLEARTPGAAKRNPNDFIDESVLEEALKMR